MPLFDQPLFFDKEAEFTVRTGRLPHWEQVGTVCFITFRTWDSMPREVIERFLAVRNEWLRAHGIDTDRPNWEGAITRLRPEERAAFRRLCSTRWDDGLDGSHGSCPLRDPARSKLVADSLAHFDEERYVLFDFVVMPNHVHVLASFPEVGAVRKQCDSWKHYTATQLNRVLARRGRFWEEESFDHLTRSEAQFERLRDYIADNPRKANLRTGEFVHYSRELSASPKRDVSDV
jgi:type I restriction enzyme R subunit